MLVDNNNQNSNALDNPLFNGTFIFIPIIPIIIVRKAFVQVRPYETDNFWLQPKSHEEVFEVGPIVQQVNVDTKTIAGNFKMVEIVLFSPRDKTRIPQTYIETR